MYMAHSCMHTGGLLSALLRTLRICLPFSNSSTDSMLTAAAGRKRRSTTYKTLSFAKRIARKWPRLFPCPRERPLAMLCGWRCNFSGDDSMISTVLCLVLCGHACERLVLIVLRNRCPSMLQLKVLLYLSAFVTMPKSTI